MERTIAHREVVPFLETTSDSHGMRWVHNFLYLVNHEVDCLHMYLHPEEDEHSEDSQEDEDDGVDDDNSVYEEGPPEPISYDQHQWYKFFFPNCVKWKSCQNSFHSNTHFQLFPSQMVFFTQIHIPSISI